MSVFDEAFTHVVGVEGGYSDNPADSGGPTKWGVTERVARDAGYMGSMRDLPLETAKAIYKNRYWDLVRLDDVASVSLPTAVELFDTAVNTGVAKAGLFLQRALNALNRQGKDYRDLTVDGLVGPATVAALKAYVALRGKPGVTVLLRLLNVFQATFYVELTEARQKDETFLYGWVLNRVVM